MIGARIAKNGKGYKMKAAYIHKLLVEASTADVNRATEIICELCEAMAACLPDGTHEIDTPAAGIETLLDTLFILMYHGNPRLLPAMLPVFFLACGDRPDGMILVER